MQSSRADIYIGLNPEDVGDYIWQLNMGIGTQNIKVSTSNPEFYIGAFYYVTVKALGVNVEGNIRITQRNSFV